jgi:hypothetical protein
MLQYTCLIKHAKTLSRTKACYTYSLLHAQQDALTHNKDIFNLKAIPVVLFLLLVYNLALHTLSLRSFEMADCSCYTGINTCIPIAASFQKFPSRWPIATPSASGMSWIHESHWLKYISLRLQEIPSQYLWRVDIKTRQLYLTCNMYKFAFSVAYLLQQMGIKMKNLILVCYYTRQPWRVKELMTSSDGSQCKSDVRSRTFRKWAAVIVHSCTLSKDKR